MKFTPLPHQPQMIDWGTDRHEAAWFVPPGRGKTACSLRVLDDLATTGEAHGALIIAPIRVCAITWPDQVQRWDHSSWMRVANLRTKEGMQAWHDKAADVYLINPEQLPARLPDMFPRPTSKPPCDTLIVDELSLAKNPSSKRFRALLKQAGKFQRRLGMTGTPVPNDYQDVFAQVRLLDLGKRFGKAFGRYRDDFFYPADFHGYRWKLRKGAKEEIDSAISDLALVQHCSEDELPSSSTVDIDVQLPPAAMKTYATLEKELLATVSGQDVSAVSAAVLTNKLIQVTSGAVYTEDRAVAVVHAAKLQALLELRKKLVAEPLLVLVQYKHESERILAAMPHARMFNERDMGEWMDGKIRTWVADARSLSHGIDGIQRSCSNICWFSLTWSNETYQQTNARIVRHGQDTHATIHRLIAPGTIDDAVAEALRNKSDEQTGLMEAIHALQLLRGRNSLILTP